MSMAVTQIQGLPSGVGSAVTVVLVFDDVRIEKRKAQKPKSTDQERV
jgi:hypothetical protein